MVRLEIYKDYLYGKRHRAFHWYGLNSFQLNLDAILLPGQRQTISELCYIEEQATSIT